MKSGLKAAGQEFVYGIYDGVTGLVTQPYTGARDGGAAGFVKGVGMGLTGFVLKDISAIIGPFGYTFKGIHKELLKGNQPTKFIRKARILEGQRDLGALVSRETFVARVAAAPAADDVAFVGVAGLDDLRLVVAAVGATHGGV